MSYAFPPENLPTRLQRVVVVGECLVWQGHTDGDGYGYISWKGKRTKVCHVAYAEVIGDIPEGLHLDHVKSRGCSYRACCNPLHLEPVSQSENFRRGDAGRKNREKTHCPSGHAYDEENTRVYQGTRFCRRCDRERRKKHE